MRACRKLTSNLIPERDAYLDATSLLHDKPEYLDSGFEHLLAVQQLLATSDQGRELLRARNLEFLSIPINSKWVRDYGPLIAVDSRGHMYCIDTQYRALGQKDRRARLGMSATLDAHAFVSVPSERTFDDVFPTLLAERLRRISKSRLSSAPIAVLRPPIALDCGDFITDGAGLAFTTTNTIRKNGGDRTHVDEILFNYLGIDEVLYLEPLPGNTIKHVDMFLKAVAPDVMLIAEVTPFAHDDPRVEYLSNVAARVLQENKRIIVDHYRSKGREVRVHATLPPALERGPVHLISVPIPSIRTEYHGAAPLELDLAIFTPGPWDGVASRATQLVLSWYGHATSVESRLFPEDQYSTFLNFLHVNQEGPDLLIVPAYGGAQSDAAIKLLKALYSRTYGRVELIRLRAQALVRMQGGIHCLTNVLPKGLGVTTPFSPAGGHRPSESATGQQPQDLNWGGGR